MIDIADIADKVLYWLPRCMIMAGFVGMCACGWRFAVRDREQAMTPESLAKFIAQHGLCACVEVSADTLTVCSVWTRPGTRYWGWKIERIPATRQAVRDWLNY